MMEEEKTANLPNVETMDERTVDEKTAAEEATRRPSLSIREPAEVSLKDADEARAFLDNHPRAEEILEEGQAILDDPVRLKKLLRKIDFNMVPLIASVYFLQYLDKTTLNVRHFRDHKGI